MRHVELTKKNVRDYLSLFHHWSQLETCSFDAYSRNGCVLPGINQSCYADVPRHLIHDDDHCGVLYNGYNYPICLQWKNVADLPTSNQRSIVKAYGISALLWLEFLLGKESPFQELFPFMYTTNPKTILAQRGFIFKNMHEGPIDLLCMFISCARCVSENPRTMQHYWTLTNKGKVPPIVAAFISLTYVPDRYPYTFKMDWDTVWNRATGHGYPFGFHPSLDQANHWIQQSPRSRYPHANSMNGCQRCFGGDGYDLRGQSLSELVELLTKMQRKNDVIEPAAPKAA